MTNPQETKPNTVKVRVKHGRIMTARNAAGGPDTYAEPGDVIEVDRKWAESLLARRLDGYPQDPTSRAPGAHVGIISDSPIELVA